VSIREKRLRKKTQSEGGKRKDRAEQESRNSIDAGIKERERTLLGGSIKKGNRQKQKKGGSGQAPKELGASRGIKGEQKKYSGEGGWRVRAERGRNAKGAHRLYSVLGNQGKGRIRKNCRESQEDDGGRTIKRPSGRKRGQKKELFERYLATELSRKTSRDTTWGVSGIPARRNWGGTFVKPMNLGTQTRRQRKRPPTKRGEARRCRNLLTKGLGPPERAERCKHRRKGVLSKKKKVPTGGKKKRCVPSDKRPAKVGPWTAP